jgi:5-methylcytosine-specific restriction endonuclease McrA
MLLMIDVSEYDNSVISDITEPTIELNNVCIINSLFENKIQKLTIDELKEKCKANTLCGLSKLKKQELIQLLLNEFNVVWSDLKRLNATELRSIYKTNNIKEKFSSGNTKESIIFNIMSYNSKCNDLFFIKHKKIDDTCDASVNSIESDTQEVIKQEQLKQEQLKQEQLKQEQLKQEQLKQEQLKQEVIKQEQLKQEQLKQEQLKQEVIKQEQLKQETIRKKKQSIPKNVKINVWNTHIDSNIHRHKCLCCKKAIISNTEFDVGHIISEKNGGTLEINNLRPICSSCNHSMGTTNMIEYIIKYGYYL